MRIARGAKQAAQARCPACLAGVAVNGIVLQVAARTTGLHQHKSISGCRGSRVDMSAMPSR